MGWVGMLGVRPAWRRRGLAEALLRHAFAEMYERGQRRIYVGMRIVFQDVAFEKELA
jgi:ribosomal protein S18 acetylase RimI-like enzyme